MCRFLLKTGYTQNYKFEEALGLMERGGPDSTNIVEREIKGVKVLMGHNRLSILDLSPRSNQPMKYEDDSGEYFLLFNGELYNFKELRDSGKYGEFKTSGDTEVLFKAVLDMLRTTGIKDDVLNGEIAFAIVTPYSVILHRDMSGVKPLYVAETEDGLIASSEIRPIAFLLGISPSDNKLNNYLRFGFNPFGGSPFEEIELLSPGQWSIYSIKEDRMEYYKEERPKEVLLGNVRETIHDSIRASVKERLISDVPISLTLSGGVDSAILAYLMSDLGSEFNAYCLTLEGSEDEYPRAKAIADHYKFPITNIYVTPGEVMNNMDDIIKRAEEPLDKGSLIATYFLAKGIKEKVTLIGEGADECFGGYSRHQTFFKEEYPGRMNNFLFRFYEVFNRDEFVHDLDLSRLTLPLGMDNGNFITEFDLNYEIPFYHTMRIDKMFMGFGVEARVPYLDKKVTSVALVTPTGLKVSPEKRVLREAFQGKMPDWMLNPEKKALKIPYNVYVNVPEVKELIMKNHSGLIKKDAIMKRYANLEDRNSARGLWLLYLLAKVKESYE